MNGVVPDAAGLATGGVVPEGKEPLFLPSTGCDYIVRRDPEVRRNILREINEQDAP